jgi:glycine cleavage system H lipoate-binding protein
MLENNPNTSSLQEEIQGVEMPKWFGDLLKKVEGGINERAEVVEKIPQVVQFCESLKDTWNLSKICNLLEESMKINPDAQQILV